jgi:ABC-type enterochelin transport system ATPase subunit
MMGQIGGVAATFEARKLTGCLSVNWAGSSQVFADNRRIHGNDAGSLLSEAS